MRLMKLLSAAALGAAALSDGPATAATQVIGAGTSPTQVVPAAAPWSQTGAGSAAGEGVTGLHGGPPEPDEAPPAVVRDEEVDVARPQPRRELVGRHVDRVDRRDRLDPLQQRRQLGGSRVRVRHPVSIGTRPLTAGHGASWSSMWEEARAEEAKIFMPSREQAQEQLTTMLGGYTEVVADRDQGTQPVGGQPGEAPGEHVVGFGGSIADDQLDAEDRSRAGGGCGRPSGGRGAGAQHHAPERHVAQHVGLADQPTGVVSDRQSGPAAGVGRGRRIDLSGSTVQRLRAWTGDVDDFGMPSIAAQVPIINRKLELVGVRYRASMQGKDLNLSLGFSHPVVFPAPEGITITTLTQTEILVAGADKQRVGELAANIRGFRPPEPYKGKGVKYAGEVIIRKEAKKA